MIDGRVFDDIAQSLSKLLPPGAANLKDDFERNAKAAVQGGLERLELVTREEFDVQMKVLERTREKLSALEARIAELESSNPS